MVKTKKLKIEITKECVGALKEEGIDAMEELKKIIENIKENESVSDAKFEIKITK
jgi:hypothetical protein